MAKFPPQSATRYISIFWSGMIFLQELASDGMLAALAGAGYGVIHIANANDLDLALAFLAIRSERTRLRICGLGFT